MFNKSIVPLVVVFLVTAALIFVFRGFLVQKGVNWQVLSGGNLFVYIITVISMHLLSKGLNADETHLFIRHAYSGIMLKLFASAAAAFIYIWLAGDDLNKPALFISMLLYLIYSFVEIRVILRESNAKKNVKN